MEHQSGKLQKWHKWMETVIFPLLLLLYPLRHICVGAEWWDTGYNYGNFLYMDHMDPMWVFSTYLGNALGKVFTGLPFGNVMVGMNFYTGLLVSLLALGGFFFFVKKVKMPALIAFAGEMLAISLCWCPTALLYNYLTYTLFGAGVVCLYYGLTENKKQFLIGAGVCLGVNVFVRFPNLAEMGLIAAVWAYAFIQKKTIKETAVWTLWCLLGYIGGIGVCLGYLSLRYGLEEYVNAILRLLGMPSEASDYTLYSMIFYQFQNYRQNLRWLMWLALFAALGMLGFRILRKPAGKAKWLNFILKISYVGCVFCGFYFLMQKNMFNMKYSTKQSVFQWAVFLLTATILAGAVTIFRKKTKPEEKLLCGLGILVILITPLGSNNHLYSSINNLFFVAPFTLWLLVRFLKWLPMEVRTFSMYPVKAMMLSMLFMLAVQAAGFGFGYVFSESDGGENLHTKIENNDILKGMYTSPDRAALLSEISVYVKENGLEGQEVILYGNIPAMSYYLQMPFAITAWPDLPSYHYQVMEADLDRLRQEIKGQNREVPVMLLEASCEDWEQTNDKKLALLGDWIQEFEYQVTFTNEKFILLESRQNRK